jgi:hypothetical protein
VSGTFSRNDRQEKVSGTFSRADRPGGPHDRPAACLAGRKGLLIGQGVVAPGSLPGSWFFPGSKRQHDGRGGRIDVSDGVLAATFSAISAIPARAP